MSKKRRTRRCALALLIAQFFSAYSAGGVLAAEEAAKTRDIVVEADAAKEEAKYSSQSTTVITKEDIAKKQAKSVEDIIFNETGVTRTVDAMGRVGVSIRGAEPRHTLILLDGQPVMGDFAKYYGASDEVMRLGTENVERIEIIRGAASAKYGADAIGGVVNIITRKAASNPGLQVNAEGRRAKQGEDIFPYQNIFLRADTGQIGKFRLGYTAASGISCRSMGPSLTEAWQTARRCGTPCGTMVISRISACWEAMTLMTGTSLNSISTG